MTISYAAEKAGCSERSIRRYEQYGVKEVKPLATICAIYGVSLDEIVFGEKKEKRIRDVLTPECVDAIKMLADRLESE